MHDRRIHADKTKGNALFLILIAVALFAALAYAMTQSSKGGGANTAKETAALQVGEMMQYAATVGQAVQRLMLANNCTLDELNFASSQFYYSDDDAYVSTSAPTDHSCDVFHPNGGGVTWQPVPMGISRFADTAPGLPPAGYTSKPEYGIGVTDMAGIGAGDATYGYQPARADVVMFASISWDACKIVQAQTGINADPLTAAQIHLPFSESYSFRGDIPDPHPGGLPSHLGYDGANAIISGKPTGCVRIHNPFYSSESTCCAGQWVYAFYNVLVIR